MKNKSISEKLSHLVCLHTSEWSYKGSKLSSLKSRLNTLFDVGIKEEEDGSRKQDLIDRKKAVLKAMEKRVKNLSWWNDVKDNTLFVDNPFAPGAAKPVKKEVQNSVEIPFASEEELKGPTLFPVSKPKVYHFHPLAFVRQMRRIGVLGYIDWDFIGKREGKEILKGYVPQDTITIEIDQVDENGKVKKIKSAKKVAIGNSGVTIATGFDIGQHNEFDLQKIFGEDHILLNLYLPYTKKTKQIAIDFLKLNPLIITKEQAKKTDQLIKTSQMNGVIKKYNSYKIPVEFKFQPTGVQTVVMSICFQYGVHSKSLTEMWRALRDSDMKELIAFFEDKINNTRYKIRRKQELEFLKNHLYN